MKWIKLTERLPNKQEQQLNNKHFLLFDGRNIDVGAYIEQSNHKWWNTYEDALYPTHWQPLPKAPK